MRPRVAVSGVQAVASPASVAFRYSVRPGYALESASACGSRHSCQMSRAASTSSRASREATSEQRKSKSKPLRLPKYNDAPHASSSHFQDSLPVGQTALGYTLPSDIPQTPLHLDGMARVSKPERKVSIDFVVGDGGASMDRRAFFSGGEDGAAAVMEGEEVPGIEVGRVVELRRFGMSSIGLVVAPILVGGRQRMLILRSSGEIWPVAPADVQFVMPASLVHASVTEACWDPELLSLWATGEDIGLKTSAEGGDEFTILGAERAKELIAARRKAAGILRKVVRETERMEARLTGGTINNGHAGGIEAVWEAFAPQDPNVRSRVSSTQAAEYLLNADPKEGKDGSKGKRIKVHPNTLPAFAAHVILMRRADLFIADDTDMWDTGTFLVRSRNDRLLIESVASALEKDDERIGQFVTKAKNVVENLSQDEAHLPTWTAFEMDLIDILALSLFEIRTIQTSPTKALAASIVKSFGIPADEIITHGTTVRVLTDIGVLPANDSLRASMIAEGINRAATIAGADSVSHEDVSSSSTMSAVTPADAALDSLRSDVSHRVFVIDNADAEELDDGIALERISADESWIHVHIADPTRFVARDDPVALRASFTGTTLYLPECTTPLLPHTLGGGPGALSLGATAGQGVMTFSARVDRSGNVHDTKVSMGWLKSAAVTTYAAVNTVLGIDVPAEVHPFGKPPRDSAMEENKVAKLEASELSSQDVADLQTLRDLATALRAKRFETAGLEFQGPQSTIRVFGHSRPLTNMFNSAARANVPQRLDPRNIDDVQYGFAVQPSTPLTTAQTVVAELMVLANRVAATYSADRDLAVPFRGMEPVTNTSTTPEGSTIEDILAQRQPGSGMVPQATLARGGLHFPLPTVDVTPSQHWIMGILDGGYVRATSPLRRYDDMLAHWQLKAALAADAGIATPPSGQALGASDVLRLTFRSDASQTRAKYASKSAEAFWRAGLFTQRLHRPLAPGYTYPNQNQAIDLHTATFPGTVVGPTTVYASGIAKIPVAINELGTIVDLNQPNHELERAPLEIGDTVQVRIVEGQMWPNAIVLAARV